MSLSSKHSGFLVNAFEKIRLERKNCILAFSLWPSSRVCIMWPFYQAVVNVVRWFLTCISSAPYMQIHHLLKGGGCPMQAEGKGCVLPMPTMGTEGCILLCRQSQVDLPVSLVKIQSRYEPDHSVSSSRARIEGGCGGMVSPWSKKMTKIIPSVKPPSPLTIPFGLLILCIT